MSQPIIIDREIGVAHRYHLGTAPLCSATLQDPIMYTVTTTPRLLPYNYSANRNFDLLGAICLIRCSIWIGSQSECLEYKIPRIAIDKFKPPFCSFL